MNHSRTLQIKDALVARYNALTEVREAKECMSISGHERALGLPSPQALEMATDAVGRGYIYPESMLHPAVASSIMALAYELMAFGLAPKGPGIAAGASSRPRKVGHHILVVDDTADVLVAVGAFLVGEGFVVVSAGDGDTALRLIANNPQIGVLITDYAMPGLTGVALIAQALEIRPDLKALIITAYPNADELAELPSQIKVLAKPFRRTALITQVKTLLTEAPPMLPDEAMELVENRQI